MASQTWLNLSREAGTLVSNGRFHEAIMIYRKIAKANPRAPDIHNNLAVALRAVGSPEDAVRSYRRALN